MSNTNVFNILKERGFIFQSSDEEALKKAFESPLTIYDGFDPTADSLHLGHLMALVALHHMQEAGHKVIFLVGGGTGRIGDPSWKSTQRVLLTKDITDNNAQLIKNQVENMGLVHFSGENAALMVNNDDWLSKFKFLDDFLINVARYFSVNEMLSMRTFEDRIKENKPLSLLEFCYPALQGWDFLELYQNYNCTVQVGGQDQWSNILSGVDLVRKALGKQVFALTFPLLTTADGVKMGKTEKGPIWLDASKTSPYDFYQYLVKTPDELVPNLLKLFTFLELSEIDEIIKSPLDAQKRLAFEVTKIVHGEEEATKAANAQSIPELVISLSGMTIVEALVSSGCLPSNAEVRRRLEQNAISVDDEKITDPAFIVNKPSLIKYGKGQLLRIIVA